MILIKEIISICLQNKEVAADSTFEFLKYPHVSKNVNLFIDRLKLKALVLNVNSN